ncbi:MAG: PKD domain-containing protein [Clostridiaceae bacterium]
MNKKKKYLSIFMLFLLTIFIAQSTLVKAEVVNKDNLNLEGKALITSVTLNWKEVSPGKKYDLLIDGKVVSDLSESTYIHKNLLPGTTHSYRVRTKDISGKGEWGSELKVTTHLVSSSSMATSKTSNNTNKINETDKEVSNKADDITENEDSNSNEKSSIATKVRDVKINPLKTVNITSDYILYQDEIWEDLNLSNGTIDLNGHKLTVNGDLIQSGNGSININGGQLYISKNYTIKDGCYGYLYMNKSSDYVEVGGSFSTGAYYNNDGKITGGILEVKGDFIQKTYYYQNNFKATGEHKVILSGTSLQTVSFQSSSSNFNILEIKNSSEEGVKFTMPLNATTFISNGNKVSFPNGDIGGWRLEQDETFDGDLYLAYDTLDLNGYKLTVNGNLIQSGGAVNINGGQLNVTGDYRIQTLNKSSNGNATYSYSYGYLKMLNDSDYVQVGGNFITQAYYSHNGLLKAGTFDIKGDFTQKNANEYDNFRSTENHKVIFSGEKLQTISFDNPSSYYSYFNILEITNSSTDGVKAATKVIVAKELKATETPIIQGSNISLLGTAQITGGEWKADLGLYEAWSLQQDVTIGGNLSLWNNRISLNGHKLDVKGNLIQVNGDMNLNGGQLYVNKNYTLQYGGSGCLYMTNAADYVLVEGNFTVASFCNENGYLTAGILEVKGDFIENCSVSNNYSYSNFVATATHKVILSGEALQTVSLQSATSKFNILEIENSSSDGVKFTSPLNATTLITNGNKVTFPNEDKAGWKLEKDEVFDGDFYLGYDTLDLNGHKLTINGNLIQSSGTVFINGGQLNVTGDYRIQTANRGNDGSVSYGNSMGYLKMINDSDFVQIGGDFLTQSIYSHAGLLKAGFLEIKGDFTQKLASASDNFRSTDKHKVILSGDKLQTVNFENPGTGGSYFNILEINNSSDDGVKFATKALIANEINTNNTKIVGSNNISIFDNGQITGGYWKGDLGVSASWTLQQDITIEGTLNVSTGYINLNGHKLIVKGDLIQSSYGSVNVNKGQLFISGNYTIQDGYLIMTNAADYVLVEGDFSTQSTEDEIGRLTAGILEIKGNFSEKDSDDYYYRYYRYNNFLASGTHKVLLSGTDLQLVKMESTVSKFNILELKNASEAGVKFAKAINANTFITNGSKVSFVNGEISGWKLEKDEVYDGNLNLAFDTLDLNGHKLTVNGNLVQSGGILHINGGQLVVTGDYRIQSATKGSNESITYGNSNGSLKMLNDSDYVKIDGNFITQSSYSHNGLLKAGIFEVGGDFTQKYGNIADNFKSTENHKVILNGSNLQTISFDYPSSGQSAFNILEINNSSDEGIKAATKIVVTKELKNNESKITGGSNISLAGNGQITDGKWQYDLGSFENWTLQQDIIIDGNLNLNGGTINLNGHQLTIKGDLNQNGGSIDVSNGKLFVNTNYIMQGGYLYMKNPSDYVRVGGDFYAVSSDDSKGRLIAGLLEIKGNFTQKDSYNYYYSYYNYNNFKPTGSHKVIFSGDKLQTVGIQSSASSFNILEIKNSSDEGVKFTSPLNATTFITNGNKVSFPNGDISGWKLEKDETFEGDLYLAYDTLDLNGHKLTIKGNLIQSGGAVYINGGQLNITGDCRLQSATKGSNGNITYGYSNGYLKMTNDNDYVKVGGNFITQSLYSHKDLLKSGTLEIKGDFTQKTQNAADNFNSTENHKVILSGTKLQTISFDHSSSGQSCFNNLEITNSSIEGVRAATKVIVTKEIKSGNTQITGGANISASSNCQIHGGSWKYDLGVNESWTLQQDINIDGSLYVNSGTINLNGHKLTVKGNLIQSNSGYLNVNGGQLYVSKDYTIQNGSYGRLYMTNINDYIQVGGNFYTGSYYSHEGYLTAGILEVKGNFTQGRYNYTGNFKASGTHKVILSGSNIQNVTFDTSDNSKFNILTITKPLSSGYKFNKTPVWNTLVEEPKDEAAPSVPTELAIVSKNAGSVTLKWTPSTDNVGIAGYDIYRDNVRVASSQTATYQDVNLTPNKTYIYTVRAYDIVRNQSLYSDAVTVTTDKDTQPPTAPKNLTVTSKTLNSISLSWVGASDNVKVTGYKIYRNNVEIGTSNGVSFTDSEVVPGNYIYLVKATDASGNISEGSNTITFDNKPPTTPELKVVTKTTTSISLSWTTSTDESGVKEYNIYRNNSKIKTINTTSYTDMGLLPDITFEYEVRAVDINGNESKGSNIVKVETKIDTESPTRPEGLSIYNKTGTSATITWKTSTDNVSVKGYEIYRDGEKISVTSNNQFTDSGLTTGNTYSYKVKALDETGNSSDFSEELKLIPLNPYITRISPLDSMTIGGTNQDVYVYFANSANVKGAKATFEYSADGEKWTEVKSKSDTVEILGPEAFFIFKWDLSSLTTGTHKVRFTVYDADNNKDVETSTYEVDRTAPGEPKNLKSSIEAGKIELTWEPSVEADVASYQIYRSDSEDGNYELIGKNSGRDNVVYTDESAEPGKICYYKVTAVDKFQQEGSASNVTSTANAIDSDVPTILGIEPANNTVLSGKAKITVRAKDDLALDSITLQYALVGDTNNWKDIGTVKTSDNAEFTWDASSINSEVVVRAIAKDKAGNSSDGSTVRKYTIDNSGPKKVTGLKANPSSTSIILSWDDVAEEDFSYFQVESKKTADGEFEAIGRIDKTLGMNVTALKISTDYWFRVVAYDHSGNKGIYSDEIKATTLGDTSAPAITSLSPSTGSYSKEIPLKANVYDNLGVNSVIFQYSFDKETWKDISAEITTTKIQSASTFSYNFDVSKIKEGSCYVRAIAKDEASNVSDSSSDAAFVEYIIDRTAPSAPSGFEVEPSVGNIEINWSKGSESDLNNYRVYRAASLFGSYSLIADNLTSLNYFDRDVEQGAKYYYRISAVDNAGNESVLTETKSAQPLKDEEAPKVLSISPEANTILSANPRISVLASDNYKLAKIRIEYKASDDTSDTWNLIGEKELNVYSDVVAVNWDTSGLQSKEYKVRAIAVDKGGLESEALSSTYKFDLEPPSAPNLIAKSGGFKSELSWTSGKEADLSGFRIFRSTSSDGTYELIDETTETTYIDTKVKPGMNYYYKVQSVDRYENFSWSSKTVTAPTDEDTVNPTADAGEDQKAIEGYEICFDGTLSKDNNRIQSYRWDFGDGSSSNVAQPIHKYDKVGSYEVTLTVTDPAGNTSQDKTKVEVFPPSQVGTLEIKVVDASTGEVIPYASVYIDFPEKDKQKRYTANSRGIVSVVENTGNYNVCAFSQGYTPKESNVRIKQYKTTTETIRLPKSEAVVGDIQVHRMSLDEIVAAGIDLSKPGNQYVYSFTMELTFEKKKKEFMFNGCGRSVSNGDRSPGGPGSETHEWNYRGQVVKIGTSENKGKAENVPPTIVVFKITQTVSWLKDFFEVDLTVRNTADPQFEIKNSSARLNLPFGLSLPETKDGQSTEVDLGTLAGGEDKTVSWFLRGDINGTYKISADFEGTIMPFNERVNIIFDSTSINIHNGEGLQIYVQAEDKAYIDEDYYISFELANLGDKTYYDVFTTFGEGKTEHEVDVYDYQGNKTTLGSGDDSSGGIDYKLSSAEDQGGLPILQEGDSVGLDILEPGMSIKGTVKADFDFEGDPDKFYYKLRSIVCSDGGRGDIPVIADIVPSHVSDSKTQTQDDENTWADPVDTSSGANLIEKELLSVTGASKFSYNIEYDSMLVEQGSLGKGWSSDYETNVKEQPDGSILVYWSPSSYTRFLTKDAIDGKVYGTVSKDWLVNIGPKNKSVEQEYYAKIQGMKDYVLKRNKDGSYTLTCGNKNKYFFDNYGLLTKLEDKNKRVLTMTRDGKSKMTVTEGISGQTITVNYNDKGLVETVSDQLNRKVTLKYNSNKCLTEIIDATGKSTTYTYDDKGHILTATDDEKITYMTNTYDEKGRVLTQDDGVAGNQLTKFSYDETSEYWRTIVTITDRNGQTRKHVSNRLGQLVRVEDELGDITIYTYDKDGNRTSAKDPNGHTTLYDYDNKGNPILVTDEHGKKSEMTYDSNDNLLTVKNALGDKVTNTYDENNNLKSSVVDGGNKVSYTYNSNNQVETKTIQGAGTQHFTYEQGRLRTVSDFLGNVTTYYYDLAGRVTDVKDREGNIVSYEYDNNDNILVEIDQAKNKVSYTYDSHRRKLTETDERGHTTTFHYDGNGNLKEVIDAKQNKTSYEYDGEDRLRVTTDAELKSAITEYDEAGRVKFTKDALGNVTSYTYDKVGNILTKTSPRKGVITNTYYPNGKIKTVTDEVGNKTTYTYDDAWRVKGVTNAAGKTTTYAYDSADNVTSVTDCLGNKISYTYDDRGNKLTETDAKSNETKYQYNSNDKLIKVTDPLGNITEYRYDKEGRLTKIIDAKGNTKSISYTLTGKPEVTTDALGNTVTMQYDEAGNITGILDAYGSKIQTSEYDELNRVVSVKDALGHETTRNYDKIGNLKESIDPLKRTTAITYDGMNRALTVLDPLKGESKQEFDEDGNLKIIVDPNKNQQTFEYDVAGNLKSETTAIGSTKTYNYNSLNLLKEAKNGRQQGTSYEYDDLGRISSRTDVEGKVSYEYDVNGNVVTATDKTGTAKREYDALNRVAKYTDVNGNEIKYSYDTVGNLIALTYPGGKIVRYEYNSINKLVKVIDWNERVTTYEYDKNGRLLKTKRANGTVLTQSYDKAGNLLQLKDVDKAGNIINQYDYTYDAVGKVTTEKSANEPDRVEMKNATMTYGKGNILETYNGQEVKYDADGNMISGPLDGKMVELSYDSKNRLIKADKTTYTYDGEDNRIAVTEDGGKTEYVNNPHSRLSQVLISKDSKGKETYYIYGNGLIGQEDSDKTYKTYHFDLRGSTTAITDYSGKVTDRIDYGPFGELVNKKGTTKTPFLFNGRDGVITDNNTLYYMRARYYNQEIKRFINQDIVQGTILDGGSLNRYAYVNGNPVTSVDPFGLSPEDNTAATGFELSEHDKLDLMGNIPLIGPLYDWKNAKLYFKEGDYKNAFISLASAAIGVAASPLKAVAGVVKFTTKLARLSKAGTMIVKFGGKAIDFGKSVGRKVSSAASYVRESWKVLKTSKKPGYLKLGSKDAGRAERQLLNGSEWNHYFKEAYGAENVGWLTKNKANFGSRSLLEGHFIKHGDEFKGIYGSADEYLQGAREVMDNGYKVQYNYNVVNKWGVKESELRIGYMRFMGNNRKGSAKFEFVGTNSRGDITTYHTESGKTLWKLLNGFGKDKTINPIY